MITAIFFVSVPATKKSGRYLWLAQLLIPLQGHLAQPYTRKNSQRQDKSREMSLKFLLLYLQVYLNTRRLVPATWPWEISNIINTFLWLQTLLWFSPCHITQLVPFVTATCHVHCNRTSRTYACLPTLQSTPMSLFRNTSVTLKWTRGESENDKRCLLSLLVGLVFFIATHTIKNNEFIF